METVSIEKVELKAEETDPDSAVVNSTIGETLGIKHDINTSGGGPYVDVPPGVTGWSWGAFLLNFVWAIGNKTWVGLICLIPYIGIIGSFYLGFHGKELAWRNRRWDSVEHFNRVQKKWSYWGIGITVGSFLLGVLSAFF